MIANTDTDSTQNEIDEMERAFRHSNLTRYQESAASIGLLLRGFNKEEVLAILDLFRAELIVEEAFHSRVASVSRK